MKNINWFKENIANKLINFEINYKYFEKGDFGELNQIEFNSIEKGGCIDFWSSGWLFIHLVDFIKGVELINILLEPQQEKEKEIAFTNLIKFLEI